MHVTQKWSIASAGENHEQGTTERSRRRWHHQQEGRPVTVYMASSHPDHPPIDNPGDYLKRTAGAHRRASRFTSVTRWIRAPRRTR